MRAAWFLALALHAPLLSASDARSQVALRVGTRALSVADVEQRLASLPPARLHLASSAEAPLRALLDQALIPDLLWEQHLAQQSPTSAERSRALAFAMERRLTRSATISDAEIAAFYQENRRSFERGASVLVWRIVTATEAEAKEILEAVRGATSSVEVWSKLARERSLDTATKMRRGSLGFVTESGTTEVPQVRVNPAVFQAVKELADGELMAVPIKDGEHYSALWRRGSHAATSEPLSSVKDEIRGVLQRRKARKALEDLLATLRSQQLRDYRPEELESIVYGLPASTTTRKPLTPHAAEGQPQPSATPDGDR